jgi:hypothetical protein
VHNTYNRGWQENPGKVITYNIKGVPLHAMKTHGGMEAFLMLKGWGPASHPNCCTLKERQQCLNRGLCGHQNQSELFGEEINLLHQWELNDSLCMQRKGYKMDRRLKIKRDKSE